MMCAGIDRRKVPQTAQGWYHMRGASTQLSSKMRWLHIFRGSYALTSFGFWWNGLHVNCNC